MSERNTHVRSMHDIGLTAWFGGSLAGAVAINGAAADVSPAASTPPEVAKIQKQLGACQWLISALPGGVSALTALAGEQQRPEQQRAGMIAKPAVWLRAAV